MMNISNVTNGSNVNSAYGIYAFKKANQTQKDLALQLINSVPLPKPLGKHQIDILA